jgi:uncharacterized protein (TIGR00299 family) protein
MQTLYFDCFSGVSGDMIIGALLDLGVDFNTLQTELQKLHLPGYQLRWEKVSRAHISGTKFHVALNQNNHAHAENHEHPHSHEQHEHSHAHHHEHHEHSHEHEHEHSQEHEHEHSHEHEQRKLSEISALLAASDLSDWVKETAQDIFYRLAVAEGKVHGIAPTEVHFHEVGAIDAIVDIVGACIGFELLGVELFLCSPLHVGQGFIECAHGSFPVPAPGTLELLKGAPIYSTDIEGELVTPTGAAIVSTLCEDYVQLPEIKTKSIGYGAGSRDIEGFPNMLRLLYGDLKSTEEADTSTIAAQAETILVIEANIDDMNPQVYGYLMDLLLAEGALDIFYTPIQMKKNRPGILLTVLTPRSEFEKMIALLFRETTTIGLRYYETNRRVLTRDTVMVQTDYGAVGIKIALEGSEIINAMPEYEDCSKLAKAADIPLANVQAAAISAFEGERENLIKMIREGNLDEEK